jgi:hypothetical protein
MWLLMMEHQCALLQKFSVPFGIKNIHFISCAGAPLDSLLKSEVLSANMMETPCQWIALCFVQYLSHISLSSWIHR